MNGGKFTCCAKAFQITVNNDGRADFAANPIGTFFDPSRVYDALKSGAEFKTLQASIRAGQYLPASIPNIGLPV